VLDRAIALAPGTQRFADLAIRIEPGPVAGESLAVRSDLPYADAKAAVLHDFERRYIADLLAREDGNLSAASRASGVDRKHLRTLARKHGLVDGGEPDDN
jgi:DNA-binding NtrC family response regulator